MSRPVAPFAIAGLVAMLLVGLVGVQILRGTGRKEAIRDSREVTRLAGQGVVAPQLRPGLTSGDPDAIAAVDRVVRGSILRAPVVRVKIWDATGRILYSDRPELIGQRYHLGDDELAALRSGRPDAEVSDLSKPENRFERPFGQLLEVYLGIQGPKGQHVLFETYQRYSSVAASGRRLWLRFLPALAAALVLLYLVQMPLALSLVRRIRRAQEERETLLAAERRRIAQDLHDGPVQTLAGVSFSLAASGDHEAAALTRQSMQQLRTLLVDIYPPSLEREGLRAALSDLLKPLGGRGVETELDVPATLPLTPEVEALLYRAAQEAVRNVSTHAQASSVTVRASAHNGHARLEVTDDGRGFVVKQPIGRRGHFGLQLVHDIVREAGGRVEVRSAPGEGTTVAVEVPTR